MFEHAVMLITNLCHAIEDSLTGANISNANGPTCLHMTSALARATTDTLYAIWQ